MGPVRDYAIMSINDNRIETKRRIRSALADWVEHDIGTVNGQVPGALEDFFRKNPFIRYKRWHPRTGEAGYWGSLVNACLYVISLGAPVAVFEDDAEITPAFTRLVDNYLAACSDDIDAFQLFTWESKANPRATQQDKRTRWPLVTENWNEWPLGGIIFWPSGAAKVIRYLHDNPITTTGDVALSEMGSSGVLKTMSPGPYRKSPIMLVHDHYKVPSTIHGTRLVNKRILPTDRSR